MIERANGRTTVPQIFIGAAHVGGCDDLYELEGEGKLDPLLNGQAVRMTGTTFRVGLIQTRAGRSPAGQSRRRRQTDRRGQGPPAPTTCRRRR